MRPGKLEYYYSQDLKSLKNTVDITGACVMQDLANSSSRFSKIKYKFKLVPNANLEIELSTDSKTEKEVSLK